MNTSSGCLTTVPPPIQLEFGALFRQAGQSVAHMQAPVSVHEASTPLPGRRARANERGNNAAGMPNGDLRYD